MADTQRNIVFLYRDNFGWGELGCGSTGSVPPCPPTPLSS